MDISQKVQNNHTIINRPKEADKNNSRCLLNYYSNNSMHKGFPEDNFYLDTANNMNEDCEDLKVPCFSSACQGIATCVNTPVEKNFLFQCPCNRRLTC